MSQRQIFYDFETNGLWSPLNQPIEVCMLICDGEKETKFSALIKPPYKLSNIIIEKTGITDELLAEQGKEISEVFKSIREILFEKEDTKLIGWFNRKFDDKFLNYNLQKFWEAKDGIKNIVFDEGKVFDCAAYFKAEILDAKQQPDESIIQFEKRMLATRCEKPHTLKDALTYYAIEHDENFHRAEPDAIKTKEIYKAIQKNVSNKKQNSLR